MVYIVNNTATEYGGAIYHEDSVSTIQCNNVSDIIHTDKNRALTLPKSFLQINHRVPDTLFCPQINSVNDSAGKDGNFLYGGLLDRSRLQDVPNSLPYDYFTSFCSISVTPQRNKTNAITSAPFMLSLCGVNDSDFKSVYRGQTFRLHVVALGQGKNAVSATIQASISSTARLNLGQNSQQIPRYCSQLTYNLYSSKEHEKLTLYPDGPCRSLGQASTVINVTFRPCPAAFSQSDEECVCEDRLKKYNAT